MTVRPYYDHDGVTLYHGDCLEILPTLPPASFDLVLADPPYGDTSLDWDMLDLRWLDLSDTLLRDTGSVWCFGSLRMFMTQAASIFDRWKLAQDIIWEKHNGSSFHADRFKRVHEHAVQFYRKSTPWGSVYKSPVTTPDATKRVVRRKKRPAHTGHIDRSSYISEDGGPRLMTSVIPVRSCHGYAVHPTQKPLGILQPLVEYSCPPGGSLLDPTCGSGSALVQAKATGRTAVGVERDEAHCESAAKRLTQTMRLAG